MKKTLFFVCLMLVSSIALSQTYRWLIKPEFNEIGDYGEGKYSAKNEVGRWGYIDSTGLWIIKPIFNESAGAFKNGRAVVVIKANEKLNAFIIDSKGARLISEPGYEEFTDFGEFLVGRKQFISVLFDNKYNKIRDTFYAITDVVGNELQGLDVDGDKWAVLDRNCDPVVASSSDYIRPLGDGLYLKTDNENDRQMVLNLKGQMLFETRDDGSSFNNGLIPIRDPNTKKFGYADKTGRVTIPFAYDFVTNFFDGIATVSLGEKYGAIDTSGKLILPVRYEEVNYINGMLQFKEKDLVGFASNEGKVIFGPQFKYFLNQGETLKSGFNIVCLSDGKTAIISAQGKVISLADVDTAPEDEFDFYAYFLKNGKLKARRSGKWGVIEINP